MTAGLSLLPRLATLCLALALWNNAASAQTWIVKYRQHTAPAANLVPSPNTSEEACPDHMKPVRLRDTIDLAQLGEFTLEANLPRVTGVKGEIAFQRVYEDPRTDFRMTIDVVGCLFQKHFLPHAGTVTLSGGSLQGEIEQTFSPTEDMFPDLGLRYIAQLAGPVVAYSMFGTRVMHSPADDSAIGALWIDFRPPAARLQSKSSAAIASFKNLSVRLHILIDEDVG